MNRFTQPMTYEEICAMPVEEYARFQEAAKERAHVLRREVVDGVLDFVVDAVARGARVVARGLTHAPRRSGNAKVRLA
jgi:hypothetical protein